MKPLIPYFEPLKIAITDSLAIQGPGLFVVAGFTVGAIVAVRKARRDGLDAGVIYRLLPWVAIGIMLGGHLGYLFFYEPRAVIDSPSLMLHLWRGQSAFGGFIGCTIVALWFYARENRQRRARADTRRPPIDPWAYTDAYLYGFTIGWAICRIGCFSVHDHPGIETQFWLGVYGACPGGDRSVACHDMGLYEVIWSLGTYVWFRALDRRPRFPGFFSGALFVSHAIFRLFGDFMRHPLADARYFGLTPAQYGSLVMLGAGIWLLARGRGREPVRPAA